MWLTIVKDLFSLGTELYATLSAAKEEEQQHALEFMQAKIGEMRAYGADLKERLLKRNDEFLERARKQAAELAGNDGA